MAKDPIPEPKGDHQAADLIRNKLSRLYDQEPSALAELDESEHVPKRSQHQQFMHQLSQSGKNLAAIQTEWHNYYQNLSDKEKHQVWEEFYSSQSYMTGQGAPSGTDQAKPKSKSQKLSEHKHEAATARQRHKLRDVRNQQQLKKAIQDKVSAGGKLETKHHLQSLLFGLGVGLVVLTVFMFSFFNEVIIAPFIQPSRTSASTPLIVSDSDIAVSGQPKIIIPKINLEIPVDYNQTSIDEDTLQTALESGIVHYPTTTLPGQTGNAAFFGHSSNNIFNKGKYKFAFVLLHQLEKGDTFYLTYNQKAYVYKVTNKQVVEPNAVGVLNPIPGQTATATLITCDPPGTNLKRLVVVGEQVSPDPSGNTATTQNTTPAANKPQTLPGNSPTLWSKLVSTNVGKIAVAGVVILGVAAATRLIYKRYERPIGNWFKGH